MKGGVKHRLRITQNGWHGNFSALLVKWSSIQCNPEDKFSQRMCNYQTTQAACNYLTSDCLFSIQNPFLSSSGSTCLEFGQKGKLYSCNLTLLIFLSRPFQYWFYYKLLYSLAESSSQPVKSHSQWWFCILGAQGFSAASSLEVGWHHIQIFSWITWDMLRWSVISESQDKPVAEPSGSFQTPSCIVCYCGAEWATSWSESYRIDHGTNGKDSLQEILKQLKLQLCWSTKEHRQD